MMVLHTLEHHHLTTLHNMKNQKNILQIDNTTSKNFSYKKGDVSLIFSLRTDIKTQLKDFAELLKVALREVLEVIEEK